VGIIVLADLRGTGYLLNFVGNVPFGDKIGHFCLMGMFSLLVNLALNAKTFQFWKLNYLLGSLIVLTLVTAEEISQIFIRGRNFDSVDLIFDYAGIFICGEAARFICRKIAVV
jgi:VanZ family protein